MTGTVTDEEKGGPACLACGVPHGTRQTLNQIENAGLTEERRLEQEMIDDWMSLD
jgi:hypothetical protein